MTASDSRAGGARADDGGALPEGACDCHVHVIGPAADYPMDEGRAYTPGPASVADLRAHLARLGLQRAVIVQPSVYGTDNRCLLDALALLDGAGRGIAVLPEDASRALLLDCHARGVRGVRINLESAGGHGEAACREARLALARWSAPIADLGWHVQLYAASSLIAALADDLVRLPAPVVLDHLALVSAAPGSTARGSTPADAGAVLPDLLRSGRVHVKCSAPYRLPDPSLAAAWAATLLAAEPSAVLWGSDWPHTGRAAGRPAHQVSPYRDIRADALAGQLTGWFGTAALARQVLVDNPAGLYGF